VSWGSSWLPWAAWGLAVVVAVVVLGFCLYELAWKSRRLQRDLRRLQALTGELDRLRSDLAGVQRRVADARPR
jgi:uncharacterized membrane-anchored protein YhcB (DUF1043 family)